MDLELDWFGSAAGLIDSVEDRLQAMLAADLQIAAKTLVEGYCSHCAKRTGMLVNGGAMFADDVNLREGLVCQNCGLNARSRQLFLAVRQTYQPTDRLALLEAFSPLSRYLAAAWPSIQLSEFHSAQARGGALLEFPSRTGPRRAIHQDMLALSYPDESLDGIIHNDVLEHVPDAVKGLRECRRVLKPGASAVFTMPWFPWLRRTLVRGTLGQDGSLTEHLPRELHGDGLRPEGIYTFYNFGADFDVLLAEAGFSSVAYGLCYAPSAGLLTNNYRHGHAFLMLPTVIRAFR